MGKHPNSTAPKQSKKAQKTPNQHQIQMQIYTPKQSQQINKKPLSKYLPHSKYLITKEKAYRKKLSDAIKNVKLDKLLIKKAVECLCKYVDANRTQTDLTKQQYVYLEINTSRIPEQHSVRPIQIRLPHPIYSPQYKSRYTIITSNEVEDQFTEKIDSLNTPMLRQILSYQKVKKNYKQIKDKQELLAANDLLFCDWKIYNLLRQPLGKPFYDNKKYPFPIDCNQVPQNLKSQYNSYQQYINGLADYTYTMLGNGPSYTIKVGKTKMTARQLVKNIMHASYSLIANISDNDKKVRPQHIRQISIKSYNSPSLPIYNFLTKQEIECFQGK